MKTFGKGFSGKKLDELVVNAIRCLSMDIVEKAKSGHPGMPMGAADFAYAFWTKILKHSPRNPEWPNRDRFVLSAGHGSALLYTMLYLTGYRVTMDDLKNFRQWESRTPGHPEYGCLPGVECTTGPLGQGFAMGVGMAIAERILASLLTETLIDHYTYAFVSDGDLMEGISSEAASLAGHLKLGKLIYFYDDNRITIEGTTDLAFSEDVAARFAAYGWQTIKIDGHNLSEIEKAFTRAQKERKRPTLIIARTSIAKGSPNKQDDASSHGAPLGEEEVRLTKENLCYPCAETFFVPERVREVFARRAKEMDSCRAEWQKKFLEWREANPKLANLWDETIGEKLPDLEKVIRGYRPDKAMATRAASGEVIQILAKELKNLIGGSADLGPSNKTAIKVASSFQSDNLSGRNLHFGVREHAMGSILNGLAVHGGIIPFGGTFFIFVDYMRPAIRLAAMMGIRVVYVFTHDSIFVGEDGPTHQPVEHLASLRAIPRLTVIRPADATETAAAWKVAVEKKDGPTALLLTRQKIPVLDRKRYPPANMLEKGAYILKDSKKVDIILIASGSEVAIALEAAEMLEKEGKNIRLVNMPSWELFEAQSDEYKNKVLPPEVPLRLAIEAALPFGWERYTGDKGKIIGIANRFGASAPAEILAEKFGFTAKNIVVQAKEMMRE